LRIPNVPGVFFTLRALILNQRKQNHNIIPRNAQALRATARSKITLWRHFYRIYRTPVSETFGAEPVPNVYLFILFFNSFFHLFVLFFKFCCIFRKRINNDYNEAKRHMAE